MASNTTKLRRIRDEVINLTSSPLYQHRLDNHFLPVIGEGNHQADIIFIAEAPGINEACTGHHFQGASGQIFNQLISSINLSRADIYITNIVKDKLPGNRNPTPAEINAYAPFLLRQIKIIQPKVIATLGKFSTNHLLEICRQPIQPLGKIHGRPISINCSYGHCHLIPLFHPAAALYNQNLLSSMKQDFSQLKQLLHS